MDMISCRIKYIEIAKAEAKTMLCFMNPQHNSDFSQEVEQLC